MTNNPKYNIYYNAWIEDYPYIVTKLQDNQESEFCRLKTYEEALRHVQNYSSYHHPSWGTLIYTQGNNE